MTPYEVYFYSSGGVEERWRPKDIGMNQVNAIVGYGLGGTLSISLMIVGGAVFLGHGISPEHLGTIALGAGDPLGKIGLLLALVGILFAVGGASSEPIFPSTARARPSEMLRRCRGRGTRQPRGSSGRWRARRAHSRHSPGSCRCPSASTTPSTPPDE